MASTRTQTFNRAMLALFLNNTNVAGIGDATGLRGSSTAGMLYVGLLTNANVEISYTGYQRQPINRSAAALPITNNVGTNANQINFVTPPAGTVLQTATKIALYSAQSGGTKLHQSDMPAPIYIAENHKPIIESGALTITSEELSI